MVVVLGGLVMGILLIGFTMLFAIPLMFVLLGYAVFREALTLNARAALPEAGDLAVPIPQMPPMPEATTEAAREPERPRTMVAGRGPRR